MSRLAKQELVQLPCHDAGPGPLGRDPDAWGENHGPPGKDAPTENIPMVDEGGG